MEGPAHAARSASAAAWRRFILFLALQADIVAREAGGVDRARFSQCGVMLVEPLELARLVERDRILLAVLNARQCLLAIVLGVEAGDRNPARNRGVGINIVGNFARVGRHHQ